MLIPWWLCECNWGDGLCISLNLVTPPWDALVLAEQQAGDQDDAPGMILC